MLSRMKLEVRRGGSELDGLPYTQDVAEKEKLKKV